MMNEHSQENTTSNWASICDWLLTLDHWSHREKHEKVAVQILFWAVDTGHLPNGIYVYIGIGAWAHGRMMMMMMLVSPTWKTPKYSEVSSCNLSLIIHVCLPGLQKMGRIHESRKPPQQKKLVVFQAKKSTNFCMEIYAYVYIHMSYLYIYIFIHT